MFFFMVDSVCGKVSLNRANYQIKFVFSVKLLYLCSPLYGVERIIATVWQTSHGKGFGTDACVVGAKDVRGRQSWIEPCDGLRFDC